MHKQAIVILTCTALVGCSELLGDVFKGCGDNLACAEDNFIKKIDAIDAQENVNVLGNYLVLKRVGNARAGGDEGFIDRVFRYISNREMEIKLPTSFDSARKIFAEVRSSKIKKFLIPFVVLMILKKSIEVPIFLAVVSLIAFKGLGAGLISLVLSGATAFKSFLEHNHPSSKVSYEVIPQLTNSHWSRSGVDYPNLSSGYHTIPQY